MKRAKPACDALLHPIALLALATWIVNDHYLKGAHGGLVTGKLSDVACLVIVPLLAIAALELMRLLPGPGMHRFALFATGFVMATINLFDSAAWLYRHGLGLVQWPIRLVWNVVTGHGVPSLHPVQLTMDPTDLLTLPALLVPWLLLRRATRA